MKKVISTLTIFILVWSLCINVNATSRKQLQDDLSDIQSQIDEAATEIRGVKADKSETLLNIEKLMSQISKYQDEIDKMTEEMKVLETNIAEQEKSLKVAEDNFKRQETLFQQRVVAQYKSGKTTYLDVLVGSGSIIDFISNYYLVEKVAEYDQKLLESIEKEKREIQAIKEGLDKQKTDLEAAKESKQSTQKALNNSKSVKERYVGDLSQKEKDLQADLEQFELDKKEIEAEIKRALANSNNTVYAGGVMAWPVPRIL